VLEEMAQFRNHDEHFDHGMREVARKSYYGLVSFLDDNIRQVMEALEESGSARDTSVIYLSDHGEMLGSHGFWTSSVMYEDSVAVPLMMMGRGLPDGAMNATPVSLTDIAATVKQVVGLKQPEPREAWMSRPLQGFVARPDKDRFVMSEHHDGGSPCGITMLRYRQWKHVYYAGRDCPQLFDLAADPKELNDLGRSRMHERERDMLRTLLGHVLDPEKINDEAFTDQRRLIAELGGEDAIRAMAISGHAPA
jgi:choline-sulfatase